MLQGGEAARFACLDPFVYFCLGVWALRALHDDGDDGDDDDVDKGGMGYEAAVCYAIYPLEYASSAGLRRKI